MGGGRDFLTGQSIYIRKDGMYVRRDGKPVNRKTPSSLKNFTGNVNLANEQYGYASESAKAMINEGLENIREYINKSDFRIRVTNRAMNGILDSGEIKNQMQVGSSGGAYNPEMRKELSRRMFDHDGNLEDADYEKYGYLSDGSTDAAYFYGDYDIVLKKDRMMDRTTMTLGDSLDYDVIYPSFVNNPQFISNGDGLRTRIDRFAEDFLDKSRDLLNTGMFEDSYDGYAELQFHGKVTINDIDHISMPRSWADPDNRSYNVDLIIGRLNDRGIKVTFDAHD